VITDTPSDYIAYLKSKSLYIGVGSAFLGMAGLVWFGRDIQLIFQISISMLILGVAFTLFVLLNWGIPE
jgi:multidrug transporter EmrE-like cation transporter